MNLNKKTFNTTFIISIIICTCITLILSKMFTFSFSTSFIISIIYLLIITILYLIIKNMFNIKKMLIILELIMIIPILVLILLNTKILNYKYSVDESVKEELNIKMNMFNKCSYFYKYTDKEDEINNKELITENCVFEKKDDKYKFTMIYKDEEISFDCYFENDKLKCPIQYTYPKKYVFLKK